MTKNSIPKPTATDPAIVNYALVPLEKIRLDGATQMRAGIDEGAIVEYSEAIKAGVKLPLPILYYDGDSYFVGDGHHRLNAYATAGQTQISAEVRSGTQRDAILYAAGANAQHGLRRTNADKRRAVETLLRDEEWGKWPQGRIAEACGVSREYVSRVSKEVGASCDRSQDGSREVTRNGQTFQQKTGNIGKRAASASAEVTPEPAAVEAIDPPVGEKDCGTPDPCEPDHESSTVESPEEPAEDHVNTLQLPQQARSVKSGSEFFPFKIRKDAAKHWGAFIRTIDKAPAYNRLLPHLNAIDLALQTGTVDDGRAA